MTIQGLKFWLKLAVYFKTLTLNIQDLIPSVFSLISFKTRNYISEINGLMPKRKLWSSVIALVSLSEGRGFDPSNARWKWCQSHDRIDFYTQFWFIIEK